MEGSYHVQRIDWGGNIATRTKTRRWHIEDEYRCIRYPEIDQSDFGLRFDRHHAYFPALAIAGVTVGRAMPKRDMEEIEALVRDGLPHIERVNRR